ncbi:MAG TPA: ABC transporter ATP-binding protein [Actinomycetota bacterium]|nr:ABC transporter ATP-binding protein [Actinomycetota bacterium]
MSQLEQAPAPSRFDRDTIRRVRTVFGSILEMAWSVAHGRMVALVACMVVLGLAGAVGGLVTKLVVDALAEGRASSAWLWGTVFILQFAASSALQHVLGFLQHEMGERISQEVDHRLMKISTEAPGLDHLERPEFADKLKLVRNHQYVPFAALANLNALAYMVFGLAAALVLLGTIHPVLMLMPLVAAPTGWLQFRSLRKHYKRWDEVVPEDRLAQHYLELATEPKAAKEVRIFGLGPTLIARHEVVTTAYIRKMFRDRLKRSGIGVLTGIAYGLTLAGSIGWIGYLAINGRATPGHVAMGVQVTRMVIGHVEMAASLVAWLAELSFMGERYLWLLDYEPDVRLKPAHEVIAAPRSIERGIVLEGVSFTYPETEKEVLHDVNLFLPAHSTVALVGENGAGKSTLVKLLSRFYDPTAGRIVVDGHDLRDIDLEGWRSGLGAAYQDFVRFQLLAKEAIGVGSLEHAGDLERVKGSAHLAGAHRSIDRLPKGYETQLGREFTEGTDLSEGEWQRVAIARGGMRERPVLLMMDEPTASLDARSEHEVFARFAEMSRREEDTPLTVLVSHRFSTVRMADLIVVMDGGRVAEIGTHDELIARDGRYAELFRLQASRYD